MKHSENPAAFEKRKQDHIEHSMNPRSQSGVFYLDQVQLIPDALPEIDLSEVNLETTVAGIKFPVPFFISSMTAGHQGSFSINEALSKISEKHQILMGVGSQRKELFDGDASKEWSGLRKKFLRARWAGNLGLAQVIHSSSDDLKKLRDSLQAELFFIHLNALQESLQKEGTPEFRGGLEAIVRAVKTLDVPVVIKEVGCGISAPTLEKLRGTGVAAVDVSGRGGTHWGRIETMRFEGDSLEFQIGETFRDWGLSTLECLLQAQGINVDYELWASGGVRSGLDAAKLIALGAKNIGIAQPWLAAALAGNQESDTKLEQLFQKLRTELQIALFVTGCRTPEELRRRQPWAWNKFLKASRD